MSKRLFGIIIAIVAFCSLEFNFAINTAEAKNHYEYFKGYNYYATCTFQNKNKGGNIKITLAATQQHSGAYVQLTDINGNFVWEGTIGSSRTLWLGNDHKDGYRVYIRAKTNKNVGARYRFGYATIRGAGNVNVK